LLLLAAVLLLLLLLAVSPRLARLGAGRLLAVSIRLLLLLPKLPGNVLVVPTISSHSVLLHAIWQAAVRQGLWQPHGCLQLEHGGHERVVV
jgi:hypothetical protein